jgi:hypothetical protein
MIIALQAPVGKTSHIGSLAFSHNSVRQLSIVAGTSCRHPVIDESEEAFFSNCVRQLSKAGISRRYLLVTDESSDDNSEETSSSPCRPIG